MAGGSHPGSGCLSCYNTAEGLDPLALEPQPSGLAWHRTGTQHTKEGRKEGRSRGQRLDSRCWLRAAEPVNGCLRSQHIPSSPDACVQPPPWPSWRSSPSGASAPPPAAFSQPPGAAGTGGGGGRVRAKPCVTLTVLPASLTPPHPG